MDIQKAIEWQEKFKQSYQNMPLAKPKVDEACDFTITALEELQQYRQIGTVDECRAAREKQMSKDIEFYGDSEDGKMLCPNCKEDLWDLKECGFNNCPYCGQALKWGD